MSILIMTDRHEALRELRQHRVTACQLWHADEDADAALLVDAGFANIAKLDLWLSLRPKSIAPLAFCYSED